MELKNISFDYCIKCTICTVYCPVSRVTHLFPGPKYSGPDSERLRIKNPSLADPSIRYCTNCKRCETACPSHVKIADLIQTAKYRYLKKKFRVRDFILSRLDRVSRIMIRLSGTANYLMKNRVIKFLMEVFLGITSHQTFPSFESSSFTRRFPGDLGPQEGYGEQVVYFPGCSVNYMDHRLGRDLVTVLNAMGIGVSVPENRCCGVPAIANSNLRKARSDAKFNIDSLGKALDDSGARAVLTCSSGSLALKYEYGNLLSLDNSRISDRTDYITVYLDGKFQEGKLPPMKPVNLRAAYHAPCHLERAGGVMYTISLLKKIPGLDLVILNSECCGMSGTYGFKREYAGISRDIGTQLFKKIDAADPEIVITDCVTCKWQIENYTSYRVLHPVSVLAMAVTGNMEE